MANHQKQIHRLVRKWSGEEGWFGGLDIRAKKRRICGSGAVCTAHSIERFWGIMDAKLERPALWTSRNRRRLHASHSTPREARSNILRRPLYPPGTRPHRLPTGAINYKMGQSSGVCLSLPEPPLPPAWTRVPGVTVQWAVLPPTNVSRGVLFEESESERMRDQD